MLSLWPRLKNRRIFKPRLFSVVAILPGWKLICWDAIFEVNVLFHFDLWARKLPLAPRSFTQIVAGTPLTGFGAWSVKLRHFTRTMWGQAAIAGWTPRCLRWASSTTSWTSLTSITSSTTPRTSLSESANFGWVLVLRKVEPQLTPLMAGLQKILNLLLRW